jgi:predicted lipoprotein with Yx(FWY)xxD motif
MRKLTTVLALAGLMLGASAALALARHSHVHHGHVRHAAKSVVVSTRKTSLGTILVGPNGHTLYMFTNDKKDKSLCKGQCLVNWPPLSTKAKTKATASGGVKAGKLGTTSASDGSAQVTYNGYPLYYYLADTKAGQTKGEGADSDGGYWYVMSAAGSPVSGSSGKHRSGGGHY